MSAPAPPRIAIIGAGVIGLTCALHLARDHGYDVTVYDEGDPLAQTSTKAAAYWMPYLSQGEGLLSDAEITYQWLKGLYKGEGSKFILAGKAKRIRGDLSLPDWDPIVKGHLKEEEGKITYTFDTYLVETNECLEWLSSKIKLAKGKFIQERVTPARLVELMQDYDCVVNCVGYYAKELTGDPLLELRQGILLFYDKDTIVKALGLNTQQDLEYLPLIISDGTTKQPTYLMRHKYNWILGGSAFPEVRAVDGALIEDIKERTSHLWPGLQGLARLPDPIKYTSGLRPVRNPLRLEVDSVHGNLVHNYGHGGSGWTLAWGCALRTYALVSSVLTKRKAKL